MSWWNVIRQMLAEFTSHLQLPEEPMECDILQWWAAREATFPTVSKMARQYLGAPASSAAVERLSSGTGVGRNHSGTTAPRGMG